MKKIFTTIALLLGLTAVWAQSYSTVNNPIQQGTDCFIMTNYANADLTTAVWSNTPLSMADLQSGDQIIWDFEVYFGDVQAGGHGLAFVLQQDGLNAIGNGEEAMGYGGITSSAAIEIDTWFTLSDNVPPAFRGDDHLSAHLNGETTVDAPGTAPVILGDVEDGAYHSLQISWTYNAAQPELSILRGTVDGTYVIEMNFDPALLFSPVAPIYFGITSGANPNEISDQRVSFVSAGSANACSSIIVFPVEMTAFYAQADQNKNVHLFWSTATELNNDYFEVLRSDDGVIWQTLGRVEGAGTTDSGQDYTFRDEQAQSWKNYYKLRQVDFDGTYTLSDVIEIDVKTSGAELFSLYPNPASQNVTLRILELEDAQSYHYTFYDLKGQVAQSGSLTVNQTGYHEQTIAVDGLKSGIYIVRMTDGKQYWSERLIVKN